MRIRGTAGRHMTTLGSTSLACGALLLGFTLGMQVRATQAPDDKAVQIQSVNHISVFVRSVEKTAQWHKELLGTEIPKITDLAKPPIYPKELNWNANSR